VSLKFVFIVAALFVASDDFSNQNFRVNLLENQRRSYQSSVYHFAAKANFVKPDQ
jgi:CHAT domain-containing protein